MGLFSSSKSKSSSTVTDTNKASSNNNIGGDAPQSNFNLSDLSLAGGGEESFTQNKVVINSMDGGAIDQAFNFAGEAAAFFGDNFRESQTEVVRLAEDINANSIAAISSLAAPESLKLTAWMKTALTVVAIGGVAYVVGRK